MTICTKICDNVRRTCIKCREAKFRETVFWRSSNANDGEFGDGYDEHFHVIEIFVSELMQLYTADIVNLLNVVCEEGGYRPKLSEIG